MRNVNPATFIGIAMAYEAARVQQTTVRSHSFHENQIMRLPPAIGAANIVYIGIPTRCRGTFSVRLPCPASGSLPPNDAGNTAT